MLFQMPRLNLTPPISSTSFQRPYMCYMVESRLKDRDTIYVLESPIEKIRSRHSWYTLLTTSSSQLVISSDVKAGEIDLPFPLSNYVFRRICVLWLHWLLALGLPIGYIFPLPYMWCHALYVCHTCVMCIHIHMCVVPCSVLTAGAPWWCTLPGIWWWSDAILPWWLYFAPVSNVAKAL